MAFTLLLVHALQDRPKYLSVNDGLESLQQTTRFAQAGVAVLKIEEAVLHGHGAVFSSASITF